ncbi:GntR family transcriptional regulator [Streptomyces uncialis]|uniref:GntR family transcriptional regulator n=1 Tax=Streptomyces uncialis TaxID=1048205 RepID=UPI002F95006C|nr:GntR family transcriptional regulator [Streptomyces uncialis]
MADGSSDKAAPYLRVAAVIQERIADGTWAPGDRLPSRTELGDQLGVGENVIRRAQELLISQNILEGRPGAGTYVRAPFERRPLPRIPQPGAAGAVRGPAPAGFTGTWEADSTAKVPAPPGIAGRLGVEVGELCVRTAYELLTDRLPVMLCTSWEPMTVTGGTIVVLPEGGPYAGHGVTARMAQLNITIARVVERPRPVHVGRDQAQLLGIAAGAQATLIERTHYDTTGRPVETADLLVPADRWDITYDITLPPAPPGS